MADWTGQKRAEAATVWLTSVFGVVAFLVGYARQDFGLMMKVCEEGGEGEGGERAADAVLPLAMGGSVPIPAPSLTLSPSSPLPPPPQVYGVGVVLAGAATIPDWPWLNRHPLAWLPAAGGSGGGDESGESLGVATRRATGQRRLPVIE